MNVVQYSVAVITIFLSWYIFKNRKTQLNTITAVMMLSLALAPLTWSIPGLQAHNIDKIWILYFPFLLLFSLVFPFEHQVLKNRRYIRYALFLPYFVYFFMVFMFALIDTLLLNKDGSLSIGIIRFGLVAVVTKFYTISLLLLNLFYGIGAYLFLFNKRKNITSPVFSHQIGLLLLGIRVFVIVFIADFLIMQCGVISGVSLEFMHALYLFAIVANIVVLSVSMIKYKFLNIEVQSRGVLYYFSVLFFTGLYCAGYCLLAKILIDNDEIIWLFVSSLFAFVVFYGFLRVIQKIMDYFFIKTTINYEEILTTFFAKLLQADSLNEIRTLVVNELRVLLNMHDADLIQAEHVHASYKEAKRVFVLSEMPESIRNKYQWGVYFFPIIYEEYFFGFLVIGDKKKKIKVPAGHLNILKSVAMQISLTLHTVAATKELYEKRIMEKELNLARKIQLSLLPPKEIIDDILQIAWRYNPAIKVGGDYCDVIENKQSGDKVFVIADVSGKGVNGALYMSMVRTLLHTGIEYATLPIEDVIRTMNTYIRNKIPEKTFVTMLVFVYNKFNKTLRYVHLGHNPPLYYNAVKKSLEFLPTHGMALGIAADELFVSKLHVLDIPLQNGDLIFSYTDGITEAQNEQGEFFGDDRLFNSVRTQCGEVPEKVINKVSLDIYEFRKNYIQTDDIAMLAFAHK